MRRDGQQERELKKKSAPESAGIQPRGVLHISRELALEEMQALECRFVDRHERRQ